MIGIRADRIEGVRLASRPASTAGDLFVTPGVAIETLVEEVRCVWDKYRSGNPDDRRGGTIELGGGAYFQWIGYADHIAVECSSNAYLTPAHELSRDEEERLVRWGFNRPDEDLPNFWLDVRSRNDSDDVAFAIVAVMTTVFGVYAG